MEKMQLRLENEFQCQTKPWAKSDNCSDKNVEALWSK